MILPSECTRADFREFVPGLCGGVARMQQGRRREVERVVGWVCAGLLMQLLLILTHILKSQHPNEDC